MSALREHRELKSSSGAMYTGVPNRKRSSTLSSYCAKPKSARTQLSPTRMFVDFMSPCTRL